MSGDVQPRKRKDKKKKRDDEASHGVHITKMGSDDMHLHIHEEHGTGGNWCAKTIFFSLMLLLLSVVCIIIMENRGISDVDTPLSESRFSNYFDGWVDEHRAEHDDHHDSHGSLEHDDDHDDEHDEEDDHDEPFEEEADHSEGDEEAEGEEEEDENVTPEEEDEDQDDTATAENVTAEEEEEDEENVTAEEDVDDNVTAEEADDDNLTAEDENVTEEATLEQNDDEEDDEDVNKTNEQDDEDDNVTKETSKPTSQDVQDDDDEEDDDGNFDSLEKIVDNDASELELLKEKARQQAAAESSKQNAASAENDLEDEADNAPSWASSMAVKIGVGLALALVARLVLIRKNPISNEAPAPEILMKRRLTIASPDELIPEDVDNAAEPLPEEDYSEEEIEIEEEIEYIEEEIEPVGEENQVDAGDNDYVPQTFEQLNAMYRPKDYKDETEQKIEIKPTQTEAYSYQSPYNTPFNSNNNRNNNNTSRYSQEESPKTSERSTNNGYNNNNTQNQNQFKTTMPVFEAPPPPPLVEAKIDMSTKYSPPKETKVAVKPETSNQSLKKDITYDMDYDKAEKETPQVETKKEEAHDMDYQPDSEDIDYDEDDIYDDDEEAQDDDSEDLDDDDLLDDDDEDLEEGDDEDVSDVDDTELMNRLEAKYGKLPAKEYESDEDPDDPTWTQIKPKTGGGPQSLEDDDDIDLFEQELRRANEEMMREHYEDALKSFDRLIQTYPHQPQTYLGKAQTLDQYADQRKDNRMLMEAIEYYKTYLEFDVNDDQLWEYRSAGERSLQRLRFMGHYAQCLPIHNLLIKKFPQLPSVRTQLAITYLMIDRLSDAKRVLRETLKLWPDDGLALVHYGFVLKQLDHDYHNATIYLRQGIESEEEGTQTGIFYFQLGEALQRLGKQSEAVKVFRKGVNLKLFPSVFQRSLYNEPNLKAQPFWTAKETTYEKFFKKLQDNWLAIKAEGLNVLSKIGYYMNESENLKNKGDWKQFELYARGEQRRENCLQAPITCSLIEQFPAARGCRRGQVKFSVMHPGTHIWPHCGPSNCRLRAHLGLVVPSGTRIRVAEEERTWQEGKFLIFDDSFEHEVWHEGQGIRLVLIVDIWHPELSEHQRRSLFPI
ncbi:Aspartyl/asparaginyl beta-hydroxylase [Lucilia cuprina]|nr:Aspartyl/asparaginyl beta-hydroxylase [Lucilia cuprina]